MIDFQAPAFEAPELGLSPMLRAAALTALTLRALYWLGLLSGTKNIPSGRIFTKIALWTLALPFEDTDQNSVARY